MTIPVLYSFKKSFPSIKISVLTKQQYLPLFEAIDVPVIIADTNDKHKGAAGLYRLFRELRKDHFIDAVADMHNVIRSRVISFLFKIAGIRTVVIDKGRQQLKELTRKTNKLLRPLPTRFERYKHVLNELGFEFELEFTSIFKSLPELGSDIIKYSGEKDKSWIGIAPFAAFQPKVYTVEKMKTIIQTLITNPSNKIFFFGGGKIESDELDKWQTEFAGTVNISGKLILADEIKLMAHLDLMIAMDSANMHFASLVNIPIVSIWGATHPLAGFTPWGQPELNRAQIDLYCRPCSVYGNIPCYRGDHACMNELTEVAIIEKINGIIRNS